MVYLKLKIDRRDLSRPQIGIVMFNSQKNTWARVGTAAAVVKFQSQPDGKILTLNEGSTSP
jgi:Lon protease-like protein